MILKSLKQKSTIHRGSASDCGCDCPVFVTDDVGSMAIHTDAPVSARAVPVFPFLGYDLLAGLVKVVIAQLNKNLLILNFFINMRMIKLLALA